MLNLSVCFVIHRLFVCTGLTITQFDSMSGVGRLMQNARGYWIQFHVNGYWWFSISWYFHSSSSFYSGVFRWKEFQYSLSRSFFIPFHSHLMALSLWFTTIFIFLFVKALMSTIPAYFCWRAKEFVENHS